MISRSEMYTAVYLCLIIRALSQKPLVIIDGEYVLLSNKGKVCEIDLFISDLRREVIVDMALAKVIRHLNGSCQNRIAG
jgi:hypothetical protein